MSWASCWFAVNGSAAAPPPNAIDEQSAPTASMVLNFIRPFSASPPHGFHVGGRHGIAVVVAEMSAHIVHDGGDLVVGHHVAERRHGAPAVHDDIDRVSTHLEIAVLR